MRTGWEERPAAGAWVLQSRSHVGSLEVSCLGWSSAQTSLFCSLWKEAPVLQVGRLAARRRRRPRAEAGGHAAAQVPRRRMRSCRAHIKGLRPGGSPGAGSCSWRRRRLTDTQRVSISVSRCLQTREI